jgi:hypothetical protein
MEVAIVTQFRDEARYLKEWIEFHLLVGVDKFYMVNHMSKDNPLDVLQPYIDKGIVIYAEINEEFTNWEKSGFHNEVNLVNNCMPVIHGLLRCADADWVMFLNVDEFLYPTHKDNIKDELIEYHDNIGQVSVNWRLMGNSNYELKHGELLTDKLIKCANEDDGTKYDHQRHVKSLVRKEAYEYMASVHWNEIRPGYLTCDGDGDVWNIAEERHQTNKTVYNRLAINHYILRDLTFTQQKLDIYKAWGRQIDEEEYRNAYNDDTNYDIQRFVPELKKRMFDQK